VAQIQTQTFAVPAAIAAGTALALKPYTGQPALHFDLNGATMTAQLQVAPAVGGPWSNIGAAFSADAVRSITVEAMFARINVTAHSSGQGLGTLVGQIGFGDTITNNTPAVASGGSGPVGQIIEVVTGSAAGGALANGVDYVPLVQGADDTLEFQFEAASSEDIEVALKYVMSASHAGDVELTLGVLAISDGDDPAAALVTGSAFTVTPGSDTNQHEVASTDDAT